MTNIKTLLDEFGPPPKEICLDWAWQVKELPERMQPHFAEGCRPQATWANVCAVNDGKLEIHSEGAHRCLNTDQLFHELLAWCAGIPIQSIAELTAQQRDAILVENTLQFVDDFRAAGSPDLVSETQVSETQHPDLQETLEAGKHFIGESAANSNSDRSPRTNASRTKSFRWRKRQTRSNVASRRRFKNVAIVSGVLFMSGFLTWIWLHPEVRLAQSGERIDASPSSAKSAIVAAPRVNMGQPSDSALETSDPSETPSGIVPPKISFASDLLVTDPSLSSEGGRINANLEKPYDLDGLELNESEESADSVLLFSDRVEAGVLPEVHDRVASGEETLGRKNENRNWDSSQEEFSEGEVISALAGFAKRSEEAQIETELAGVSNSEPSKQHSPVLIKTFPMLQVLRLPTNFQVRARNPGWQLRLEASEGFHVEPREPQEISGRGVANWIIKNTDTVGAETVIAVQAQMVGVRGTSLRWRVAAGSAEMPSFVLPLGREYLDAAQSYLSRFATRLQLEIDRLEALRDIPGSTSKARSALMKQRRIHESQKKLVTRLLQIVADANQIEGWLDGQLEVSARYMDVGPDESTSLLQFGDFPESGFTDGLQSDTGNTEAAVPSLTEDPT